MISLPEGSFSFVSADSLAGLRLFGELKIFVGMFKPS